MRRSGLLLASAVLAVLLASGVMLVALEGPAQAAFPGKNGQLGGEGEWSPDGTEVVFSASDGNDPPVYRIYVKDVSSGATTLLRTPDYCDEESCVHGGWGPTWSPDGTKIAYVNKREWLGGGGDECYYVSVMNADGSDQRLLFANSYGPSSWSPDGERIMFVGYTALEGTSVNSLCTVTPLGTDLYCFMPREETIGGFDFSPDGQKIAYVVGRKADGSGPSLEIANFGAAEGRTIFAPSGSGFWGGPTFSPDGKKVAFSVSSGGLPQIYTMNIDGTRKTRLGVAGMSPDWGPASTSVR